LTYGNGLLRNNPDGTYYPGDAFTLLLHISASNCLSTSVSISSGSGGGGGVASIACPSCQSATAVYISPSATAGTYTVRADVSGTGRGAPGFASASVNFVVIDPAITVKAVPANVTDSDGYLMRNVDGTWYVNDAVALKYEVDYRFKDARRGVIEPEVTRVHPYPHIADLDCLQPACTLTVPKTPATSEYRAGYAYATGIAVANATAGQGPGQKDFRFDVKLKNAGAYTGMQKSYTYAARIVDYSPVFKAVYPYLNLKDDAGSDTNAHRLVVGVHYLGSAGQDGAIEPLRRAKVNLYTNNVTALVVGTDQTDITRDAKLTWLYVENYAYADSGSSGSGGPTPPPAAVMSTAPGKHAMIGREGYVKFVSRMLGYEPGTEKWVKISNVTALQKFYSAGFGGKGMTELMSAVYRFPENRFTTNYVTVNAIDEDGYTVDRQVKITVGLRPPGTTSICDYYERNALYVTGGDKGVAGMARSDVYSCGSSGGGGSSSSSSSGNNNNNNTVTVTGTGTAFALVNMTSILPPDRMPVFNSVYPVGSMDRMPPDLVLSMPHYLSIKVSVGGVTKDYSIPLYDSGGSYAVRVMANVGQGNALVAERANGGTSSAVYVKPADVGLFGGIDRVEAGRNSSMSCQSSGGIMCIVEGVQGEATVVATNEWGGRASTTVSAPAAARSTVGMVSTVADFSTVVMVLVAAAAAVVVTVIFRKWVVWTGDAFTG
jgi:hypothetical protein